MFIERFAPTPRVWKNDRTQTVGASEVGACAKQVWFRKRGQKEERELGWGYGERGLHVEKWLYEVMRRAGFHVHHKQYNIAKDYLSATLDGITGSVIVDGKSYDPYKKNVVQLRHITQVQVQIGLWNDTHKRKVDFGVLIYINASDFQDLREHLVEPDAAAYAAAHERATYIMTTSEPPAREGVLGGGNECRLCPFQTACLGKPIEDSGKLSDADTAAVAEAREHILAAQTASDDAEGRILHFKEQIREILRRADARRAPGIARIVRSQRMILDQAAAERAGIDLSPYRKPGRETETVSIEP